MTKNQKIQKFISENEKLFNFFKKLNEAEFKCFYDLIEIDQIENICKGFNFDEKSFLKLKELAKTLVEIDKFYEGLGGIKGYYETFVSLLETKETKTKVRFSAPSTIDISEGTAELRSYIDCGICDLPDLAEIYPLGGSGDRLNLIEEKTGKSLPAALLPFQGKNLLELLILDLRAREYFYYKTYHEKIITPIVIMTSDAKDNHNKIVRIFEKNNFFERGKENFLFIKQLSMPLIDENKNFVLKAPLELSLKPGGHGMLWNLMLKQGAFDWLKNKNRKKALIRQINNPVAGVDGNLFAFTGYGFKYDKSFGFASCKRKVGSAEGMDVLKEEEKEGCYHYNIGNIEYTDFEKYGMKDEALDESQYSKFPSNTNILFVDLKQAYHVAKKNPYPGITINMKTKCEVDGKTLLSGRLELLMQALADFIVDVFPHKIREEKEKARLSTYVTENIRRKTISVTKKLFKEEKDPLGTPEYAFYEMHKNYEELFDLCQVKYTKLPSFSDFIKKEISFLFYINPLVGPMYGEIASKFSRGEIKKGSELKIDLADIFIEKLSLDGSLIIEGDFKDFDKLSKCILVNVKVCNEGIDKQKENIYWKDQIFRKGSLKILLEENAVFEARDIIFDRNLEIKVEKGFKITAFHDGSAVKFKKEKIPLRK